MAETSPIVTLLAQRSDEELEAMRAKAEELLTSTQAELDWIERAQAAKKPQRRTRRGAKRGDTKKRVLDFITSASQPISPSQVRDGLNATGEPIGSSSIYNTFKRLNDSGEIERVEEGLYRIAAQNGHRAEEIEETESLSVATAPHVGQT
ncbi:MAG TPA: hypothetical protein VG898_08190 [Solirubrobacterales bacterium]|nr:hypothetical protein [Solirubrobacterales bacterium]